MPYPAALEHGDFHFSNMLVKDGSHRLCDWGDSCITHPFFSLLVPLETALVSLPAAEKEDEANRLLLTYFTPWQLDEGMPDESTMGKILWIAQLARTLNFAHMMHGGDEVELSRWQPMIFGQLEKWVIYQRLLDEGDHWAHQLLA